MKVILYVLTTILAIASSLIFICILSEFVDIHSISHKPNLPYDPHVVESAQIIKLCPMDPSRSQIILCCDGTTWAWDKTLSNPKWVPITVTIELEK